MNVCLSGSRSIHELPAAAIASLRRIVELEASIDVGDEPSGVDAQFQKVLASWGYRAVTVWHRGAAPRCNHGSWPTHPVHGSYTDRDQAMCAVARYGLAVWDGCSRGTKRNIAQLGPRMRVIRHGTQSPGTTRGTPLQLPPQAGDRIPLWPGSRVMVDVVRSRITSLGPDEVFVFGSNRSGFHGAGSAGQACRGDSGGDWRSDARFLRMKAAPPGSPDRVGDWAVYGVGRGHQVGWTGQSYAIETIERPGREYRRKTPLHVVSAQHRELVAFGLSRPDLMFVVTPVGEGYSGFTRAEMGGLWETVHADIAIPASFRFVRLRGDDVSMT
jgi:hypothetical protein